MSYTEKHLLGNENIVYVGRMSGWFYVPTLIFSIISLVVFVAGGTEAFGDEMTNNVCMYGGLVLFAISILKLINKIIVKSTSEFVITDKRCVMKRGLISIDILDMALDKCEGIRFSQDVFGRIFQYGTIRATTGGSTSAFDGLEKPFEFRNQLSTAMDEYKKGK